MKNRIQKYLNEEKLTQNDLSKMTGLKREYINKMIKGHLDNPTIKTAFKIGKALNIRVGVLWYE